MKKSRFNLSRIFKNAHRKMRELDIPSHNLNVLGELLSIEWTIEKSRVLDNKLKGFVVKGIRYLVCTNEPKGYDLEMKSTYKGSYISRCQRIADGLQSLEFTC